jgi:uncharacterized protein with von Willebrand factor type A (vWA) domain
MNEEAGHIWISRALATYPHAVWLNPIPEPHWNWTPSIGIMQRLMEGRMYPLTLEGLEQAIRSLLR